MVEEEEAVEPGFKKRKVCAHAPMRPCARAPVPCQVCWPCGPTCAAVTGLPGPLACHAPLASGG